jgi:hypothetical protein
MKRLLTMLAVLVLFYGVVTAGLYCAMIQPPERFGAIMAHAPMSAMTVLPFETLWMRARGGSLHEGDAAPDFTLPMLDRSRTVSLAAEVRERPVVLIFGSYT